MKNTRYAPQRKLPPYAFIPGKNIHPEKEGGHLHGEELHCMPLEEATYHINEDYLYAFDLFNTGHYWESHVWWEELWNHAGRKGELADLLKGFIKVAAAGVKLNLGQESPAHGHIDRAIELFTPLAQNHTHPFYGIHLEKLLISLDHVQKDNDELKKFKFNLDLNI